MVSASIVQVTFLVVGALSAPLIAALFTVFLGLSIIPMLLIIPALSLLLPITSSFKGAMMNTLSRPIAELRRILSTWWFFLLPFHTATILITVGIFSLTWSIIIGAGLFLYPVLPAYIARFPSRFLRNIRRTRRRIFGLPDATNQASIAKLKGIPRLIITCDQFFARIYTRIGTVFQSSLEATVLMWQRVVRSTSPPSPNPERLRQNAYNQDAVNEAALAALRLQNETNRNSSMSSDNGACKIAPGSPSSAGGLYRSGSRGKSLDSEIAAGSKDSSVSGSSTCDDTSSVSSSDQSNRDDITADPQQQQQQQQSLRRRRSLKTGGDRTASTASSTTSSGKSQSSDRKFHRKLRRAGLNPSSDFTKLPAYDFADVGDVTGSYYESEEEDCIVDDLEDHDIPAPTRAATFINKFEFLFRSVFEYFSMSVVKTERLDRRARYLFGYHPHGVYAFGLFSLVAPNLSGFDRILPSLVSSEDDDDIDDDDEDRTTIGNGNEPGSPSPTTTRRRLSTKRRSESTHSLGYESCPDASSQDQCIGPPSTGTGNCTTDANSASRSHSPPTASASRVIIGVASALLHLPLLGSLISRFGFVPASPATLQRVIDRTSCHLALVPGGIAEMTSFQDGTETLYLRRRHGFIRFALKNGLALCPLYGFGESRTFVQYTFGRSFRAWFSRKARAILQLYRGRWFTLLPFPVRLTVAVGRPIYCPKIADPTVDEVNHYLALYIERIRETYEHWKPHFPPYDQRPLNIE